jgi:FKBP-type peptidyl-prolyl cis-trans isomerase
MATPKSQRIGIWIIAVVMLVGTIGSFVVMVLANENAQTDQQRLAEQQAKLQAEYDKQIAQLSNKYYPAFKAYKDVPAEFNQKAVGSKVATKDLKKGGGATIAKDTTYKAYYIGWTPRGKSFDSSFEGNKLKAPLDTSVVGVIPGWSKGVVGMKVGGVRELTIPSDLAYGEAGSGDKIPPNTPIKFVVMIIETIK